MRNFLFEKDILKAVFKHPTDETIACPDALENVPDEAIRFDGNAVVDARSIETWMIEPFGPSSRKRLPAMNADEDWQILECGFDDVLIHGDNGWQVQSSEDELANAKIKIRANIVARANAFTAPILAKYPQAEIAGWDKREAEARSIVAAADKAAAISDTKIIKALALAAGENTNATLLRAEAIVAKADEFSAISAAVEVMRDEAITTIDAVTDIADIPATLDALKAQAQALAEQYGLG
jgi:hypothetical protein